MKTKTFFISNPSYSTISATFLVKDNNSIIEDSEDSENSEVSKDSEIEENEYNNLEIVECFKIEIILCLRDEIFQHNEFDTNSEESPEESTNESDESDNGSVVSNKTGQDRADECANNDPTTIDKEDIDENLSAIKNSNENFESLPIALQKA
ncbi:17913_t:CDS:2, partial [Racocetra persica]